MMRSLVVVAVLAVGGAGLALAPHSESAGSGTIVPVAQTKVPSTSAPSAPSALAARTVTAAKPLAGIRIALDPGHQLGNHNFPRQINRPVPAGGFTKPCNTTGTATNSGYPEATVNFAIATLVKARLQALGATVLMTRTSNSQKLWGPCVDKRGEFGKKVHAVLTVSLHADGAPGSDHGFHVIAPTRRKPWTTDIAAASLRLAKALRSGLDGEHLARSNYIGGGTALSIRSDLGTLNMSDVPVAMIEIGNMRNAGDAKRMKAASGRATYAAAVVAGIRKYLDR
jgi:N-acetylmuramoyl-L-alanine amidase